MRISLITMGTVLLLSFSSLTFANNTQDPGVNARQAVQKHRIGQGIKSGELTARETRRLVKQQRKIRRLETSYKSDGHLTARERRSLHKAQNRTSRNIKKQKHDDQRR